MKYKWKTTPYAHQVRAIRKLLSNGWGGALLMEPRTGKTKTAVDYSSILAMAGKVDRAVVIAPNRVLGVWVEELLRHSPARVEIQVWDKVARKRGSPRTPTPGYDLSVLIVNYDAFAVPGRKTPSGRRSKASGRFKVRKQIADWIDQKPCIGILDESHKIKSPSGKAANMIVSMGPMFTHRLILTGTPITKAKRAHDVYMQWKFLNPHRFTDLPTLAEFKDHYGRWTNVAGFPKWLGGKNMAELARRMQEDGVVVRREDCFDLPPSDVQIIPVDLDSSAQAYDEMAAEMVTQLKTGEIAEASIPIVQTLRLAQITSGMVTIDPEYGDDGEIIKPKRVVRMGTEKLRVLEGLLEDLYEKEQKVVICARFKADLSAIARMAREMGFKVFELRGGMKRAESDASVREFRKCDDAAVFVMQPAAGSLGIDLSTSAHMIWYSLTQSWVDYTQACDRIALSRNSTTFYYLLARGTVDELLYEVLQEDGNVAKAVLQNPDRLLRDAA